MLTLEILNENIESLVALIQSNIEFKIYAHRIDYMDAPNAFSINICYGNTDLVPFRTCPSSMTGYIWPTGKAISYSFHNNCVPLFERWASDLTEKIRQTERTNVYKIELFNKTLNKIDIEPIY